MILTVLCYSLIMEIAQPAAWVGQSFNAYSMNTGFSDENQQLLDDIIREIQNSFEDAVFCPPKTSLHITLLDWIAPLVDYDGQNKDELFRRIQPTYDAAMTDILSSIAPITVHFNEIHTSPNTIYIIGHDNGEFQTIRDEFLKRVSLLPGTKLPPDVVHSSLTRFTKPISLEPVTQFVTSKTIDFTQRVDTFRLTHATREPLLEYEVLKSYQLVGATQ
jgi:hypothetical protein